LRGNPCALGAYQLSYCPGAGVFFHRRYLFSYRYLGLVDAGRFGSQFGIGGQFVLMDVCGVVVRRIGCLWCYGLVRECVLMGCDSGSCALGAARQVDGIAIDLSG
jgi:hypothetical protein